MNAHSLEAAATLLHFVPDKNFPNRNYMKLTCNYVENTPEMLTHGVISIVTEITMD